MSMLAPTIERLDEVLNASALPIVVGLGHTSFAGKDTAAKVLIDRLGFERISVADVIRQFVETLDPFVEHGHRTSMHLDGYMLSGKTHAQAWQALKAETPEARRLLQETGRIARDLFGPAVWLTALEEQVEESGHPRFVLTDVRFPDEIGFVRGWFGPVFKIERPGHPPLEHETDLALADYTGWDAILLNDDTVTAIQWRLLNAIGHFYNNDWKILP